MDPRRSVALLIALAIAHVAAGDEPAQQPPAWRDVKTEMAGDVKLTLSAPVLVARSEGYLWFPTVVLLPEGNLLAVMSNYHDDHVETSTGSLCWSGDGGLTWSKPQSGRYSDSAVRLAGGDQLLLPYYLRPRAGGALGDPYQLVPRGQQQAKLIESGVQIGHWPRPDRSIAPKLGVAGFLMNGNTIEIEGGHLATLYGYYQDTKRYSLVTAASADGVKWSYRSTVADENCPLPGAEGPCEAALARLKDGKLMCVFRLASNTPYGKAFSTDDGKTWSPPESMGDGVGSVQPALAVLRSGSLVLTGGRPGLWAWVNRDGTGEQWSRIDLLAHHNACQPADAIANPANGTSAYTEVVPLDDTHVLCIYDRLARGWGPIPPGSGETNSVWVVRITVK